MAKYLIHACNQRMWYVNKYLIPSMIEQGIRPIDIGVWQDKTCKGNLLSCIDAFNSVRLNNGGTWHLQDDVIISSEFKHITEANDRGIKCGFGSEYDKEFEPGFQKATNMWYSFPCIRVPNILADKFVNWFYSNVRRNGNYTQTHKYDDSVFREFMEQKYPNLMVKNLAPNIVNHVDYLIGGSTITSYRTEPILSRYWEEPELLTALEARLKEEK